MEDDEDEDEVEREVEERCPVILRENPTDTGNLNRGPSAI
jgi:hypothetical protein